MTTEKSQNISRSKKDFVAFMLLLLVLLLRLGFSALIYARPELAQAPDTGLYQDVANGILSHESYQWNTHDNAELIRTIGFPLFLASVAALFGPGAGNVTIAQLTLSGLLVLMVYAYLRRVVGIMPALISALILAIDPLTLLWSLTILTEGLFTVLFFAAAVLIAYWASSQNPYSLLGAGLILGLASLVRPLGQVFVVIWGIAILLFPGARPEWNLNSTAPRIWKLVLFVVPAAIVIVPWVVRNSLLWNCPTLASVDRITMRDFVAAKVMAEYDNTSLETAQTQLKAQDPGPCPQRTDVYLGIMLAHPGIFSKLSIAGTIPVIIGTSFDRWLQIFGVDYTLPDLWHPFVDAGPMAAFNVLRSEYLKFPFEISLMAALITFQSLIYLLALTGVYVLTKIESMPMRWWGIVIVVTVLALILAPGQGGHERFRVPAQPLLICLAGYGLALEIIPFITQIAKGRSAARATSHRTSDAKVDSVLPG